MSARWTITAVVAALGLALGGCAAIPWDRDAPGDALAADVTDANGLVFALGPAEVDAASARLKAMVSVPILMLSGSAPAPALDQTPLTVSWADMALDVTDLRIALGDAGLIATATVDAAGASLTLDDGLSDLCQLTLSITAGELTIPLNLAADKFGRVKASAPSAATLTGSNVAIDWGACGHDVLALPLGGATLAVIDAIEASAAHALGPELVGVVPAALGLDVAVGFSLSVGVDALGSGVVRLAVGSARETELPFELRHGRLVVPMGVGIEAEHHPCVPELALPPVATTALPAFQAGIRTGWTLLSVDVARRALAAVWSAGRMCGGRALGDTVVAAASLVDVWPALKKLPARASLRLDIWPRELPRLSANTEDTLLVSTGLVDVDLYGELDGAWLRLATVTLDGETHAALTADADGTLRLSPQTLTLRASGVSPGLLGAPDPAIAQALLAPIVEAALVDSPALLLPPGLGPRDDAQPVAIRDGYLWVAR